MTQPLALSAEIIQGRRGQKKLTHSVLSPGYNGITKDSSRMQGRDFNQGGKAKTTVGSLLRLRLTRLSFLCRQKVTLDKMFLPHLDTGEAYMQLK